MAFLALVAAALGGLPTAAQEAPDRFRFGGDFRFRVEADRSSRASNGTERADRDRLRIRLRLGFEYGLNDVTYVGGRLRTGQPGATQSPHVTLGSDLEPRPVAIDKAYVRRTWEGGSAWAGKNSLPLRKWNEMYWDDDATVEGVGLSHASDGWFAGGGFFVLGASGGTLSSQSRMLAGQAGTVRGGSDRKMTLSASILSITEDPDEDDPRLANLDYNIGIVSFNAEDDRIGAALGIELYRNLQSYDEAFFNRDERSGLVATVGYRASQRVRLTYFYARIEKYAVVARYAQDDWVRWGSATATRSSNFAGHELRAVYTLSGDQNLTLRAFTVKGLEPESADAAAIEDGIRVRMDWNLRF